MGIWDGIHGAIFDVDGTLYEKGALRRRLAVRMAAAYWRRPAKGVRAMNGLQAYRQALEELRGQAFSPDLQFAHAAAKSGYPESELRAIVEAWFERAPLELLSKCVYPKLPQLLRLMSERRIPCGVFSDYPVEPKLSAMGLTGFFGYVLCAEEIGRLKPDPAGLLSLARQMGLAPECMLYIGDRTVDLEAAARAKMRGLLICGAKTYSMLLDQLTAAGTGGEAARQAGEAAQFISPGDRGQRPEQSE